MKFYSRALRAVPLIAYAIAAASTVFQTLAYASSYEAPKANYFANGDPFSTIAAIFTAIGLIAGIALVFLLPKKEAPDDALPVPLASISASIGFAAGAIALLLSAETRLARVATVFLLLAAVYSALVAFAKKLDDGIKALVGFGTIIGCVLLAAIFYFDTSLEMNAPLKITVMFGLLFSMLYYTAEIRCLLGKSTPRLHRSLAVLTLVVGALSAIPVPLAALIGCFDQINTRPSDPLLLHFINRPTYLAGALIVLGTWITVAIRLWGLMRDDKKEETAISSQEIEPTENENAEIGGENA